MSDTVSVGVYVYSPTKTCLGFKVTSIFKGQTVATAVTSAILDGLNLNPRAKRQVFKWSSSAGGPVGNPLDEEKVRIQETTMLAVVLMQKEKKKSRR